MILKRILLLLILTSMTSLPSELEAALSLEHSSDNTNKITTTALTSSIPAASLALNHLSNTTIADIDIWRHINQEAALPITSLTQWEHLYQSSSPITQSLVNQSGAYIGRIALTNRQLHADNWFIKFNANFIDTGIAYWQSAQGNQGQWFTFSQLDDAGNPMLLHSQVFELTLNQQESGTLWLYIAAKHYALPLTVNISSSPHFFKQQFITNSVTLLAIAVMLTLALIALMLYVKTHYRVTLACAGYIGLHGVGWAAASGFIDDMLNLESVNSTYWGMIIFPFAIAAAARFTQLLFNFEHLHKPLATLFNGLVILCLLLGLTLPLLSFSAAFTVSHIIALLWVPLAIAVGINMLVYKDFRAKYYLLGNLVYGMSLLYYMLSHSHIITGQSHSELVVLAALAVDCVCILLSLTAWLQQKKQDYSRAYYQARIDPLTQIGNRYALSEALKELTTNYIIIFIDFDGIKRVNDRLGHDQGDELLRYGARLMSTTLNGQGQVFRTGGDEFVWLVSTTDSIASTQLIDELAALLQQCHTALTTKWPMSGISYGIAHGQEGRNQSECLALADQRMYQHKRAKTSVFP